MDTRERFQRMYAHKEADRVPILDYPWEDTVDRWVREGMPTRDYVSYFDLDKTAYIRLDNSPRYPTEILEETDEYRIYTTPWGAKRRSWKHMTSTPEDLDFRVKTPDDWIEAKARMTPDDDRIPWQTLKDNWAAWRKEGRWITGGFWFGFDITHSGFIGTQRLLEALILSMCSACLAAGTDPLLNEKGVLPLVNGDVTISFGISTSANVTDYDENTLTHYVEETTGIDIEWIHFPSTDAESKLELLVNSGDTLPDVITFGTTAVNLKKYADMAAIIPLNDLYADMGDGFRDAAAAQGYDPDQLLKMAASSDGNIYAEFVYAYALQNVYSLRAFINQTWLDKLGATAPTTSDELYDLLVRFRDEDPNGNCLKDEIPMMGGASSWKGNSLLYIMNMFLYSDGLTTGYLPLNETDGKIDVSYDKDAYREYLIYANKLVEEGLLSELSFTQTDADFNAICSTDPASLGVVVKGGAYGLFAGNSPDLYVPMEAVAGPEGAQYATTYAPAISYKHMISADCAHPEVAFALLMWRHSDPVSYMSARYGEYGVDWEFAAEGTPSMFSTHDAYVKVINAIWGTQSSHYWGGVWHMSQEPATDFLEEVTGNTTSDEYNYAVGYEMNQKHGIPFSAVVPTLAYTVEETEEWADTRTAVATYVTEARTLFALGEMDPADDGEWNAYLAKLDSMNYKGMLEVDQQAYDRMMG